jgi:hypothetical protein
MQYNESEISSDDFKHSTAGDEGNRVVSEEHLDEDRRNEGSIWRRILGTREP